jgi:hypothetical protein
MGNEIQLISDGDGLAILGKPADVERFIATEGLTSKQLGSSGRRGALEFGAVVAQKASELSENSGRWVKLTKESAAAVKKYGLMDSTTPGVAHAMVGKPGEVKRWLQFVKSPATVATNPAMLAGAAGMMAQMAMQQQMAEITEYLEKIDEKLDDVLRAQTNQVLARVDGVRLAIREAMSIRDTVGRVSEVTWSKVQSSSSTILETQAYALRQLADLTDKVEQKSKLDELAESVDEVKTNVQTWLSVLARCCELHDGVGVLELDRVLDASPDELDRHRLGLKAARQDRVELIGQATHQLLERMNAAADTANSKVLLHPAKSPAIVASSNQVAVDVQGFDELLGIESSHRAEEARRWVDAAADSWDKARDTGTDGIGAVKRFGSETISQAKSIRDKVAGRISERKALERDEDKRCD